VNKQKTKQRLKDFFNKFFDIKCYRKTKTKTKQNKTTKLNKKTKQK